MSDETKHTVQLLPQVDDRAPRPKETVAALEPVSDGPSSTLDLEDEPDAPERPRRIHRRGVAAVLDVPTLDLDREAFEAARPQPTPTPPPPPVAASAGGGHWRWLVGLGALAAVLMVVLYVLHRRG